MRNKKKNRVFLLLILLLAVGIGFAALATTLKINGTTNINLNTWNIYWDNIHNQSGVTPTVSQIVSEDANHPNNIINFSVDFEKPGDYYEFEVYAVNAGTLDAEILSIEKKYNDTDIPEVEDPNNRVVPAYLSYVVTYADGSQVRVGDKLVKRRTATLFTKKAYKIRVEYDKDLVTPDDVNTQVGNVTHTFTLEIVYGQRTPEPSPFELPQGKTPTTLELGDEICMDLDNNQEAQCFNFLKYDSNGDAVLFAKYNLNVGNNSYENNETFIQNSHVLGYRPREVNTTYGNVKFASRNYWITEDDHVFKTQYGSETTHNNIYDPQYQTSEQNADSEHIYSVAYYVEKYKSILEDNGATIKDVRLITYDELTDSSIGCNENTYICPETGDGAFVSTTSYWVGSGWYGDYIYGVDYNYSGNYVQLYNYSFSNYSEMGVRPIIVVKTKNL